MKSKNEPRRAKPGSAASTTTCARAGCKKKVTMIALRHGDVHCSKVCFQEDNGLVGIDR